MKPVSIENAAHYLWGEKCDGWHLVQSESLSVIQERIPSGSEEVKHYHQQAEQFFYVLAGTATMDVNGKEHTLVANQGIHIPAKIPHQLKNLGQNDLSILVISTPPSHGDRIVETSD